jgi:hypothetical protein
VSQDNRDNQYAWHLPFALLIGAFLVFMGWQKQADDKAEWAKRDAETVEELNRRHANGEFDEEAWKGIMGGYQPRPPKSNRLGK